MMQKLLKPRNMLRAIAILRPYLVAFAILSFFIGLYNVFWISPDDYQQGYLVRILYIHVPSAWLALGIYTIMAVLSFYYLVYAGQVANIFCRELAAIGCAFALITLFTGSIWGNATWGTWWAWDARLTFMLILFFFYVSYIILARAMYDKYASKAPATLVILGFVNVPIVKFSVDMWSSLHQPASVFRANGPAIDSTMILPLCLMLSFSVSVAALVLFNNVESALLERQRD
jgi:heme exporter protein C